MNQSAGSKSLADVLRLAIEVREPISLVDAVRTSQATGSFEHINVETVFTESHDPLTLLEPLGPNASTAQIGNLRVLWMHDAAVGNWFLAAWPTGLDHVYHLVTTVHTTDSRLHRTLRRLDGTRRAVRTFLNHRDFQDIGTSLSEFGNIEIGRVTARSVKDGSSDSRGWKASTQSRPDHHDVLRMMEYEKYSIRTLTIHVDPVLSLHLRRQAGATYYSGDFEIFHNCVLQALARATYERRALVVGRQRRESESVRPISVSLSSPMLADVEATGEVLREVGKLPRTTLAVFHRNPYLHFAVTDEVDGSNFDVMVTEANAVDVYPGYRATPAALARLIDFISERFGGDHVSDRRARDYSLEELSLG